MSQQTAVEWLVEQLLDGKLLMPSLIEQAKQMEKEQIINARADGIWEISKCTMNPTYTFSTSEQYYNETYNTQQQ